MFDIITASDGWDKVAADWAVAAGLMSQSEADMRFAAENAGELLAGLATLVDEGSISPDQAARLMAPIVEAIQSGNSDISALLSQTRKEIQAFVSGDWFDQLQAEEGFIDPIERKTMAMLAGAETRLGGVQGAVEGLSGATDEGLTMAQNLQAQLEEVVGTGWDLDIDHTSLDASLEQAEAIQAQLNALTGRRWTVTVEVAQAGGVTLPSGRLRAGDEIPEFATGTNGWLRVPGPRGAPQPIVVHGGEELNVAPAGLAGSRDAASPITIVNHNYSAGAVAMAHAIYDAERMKARNAFMGE
jgi:hypothetical protein